MDLDPVHLIADEAALRGLYPPTHAIAAEKVMGQLDAHARAFLARSPFLASARSPPEAVPTSARVATRRASFRCSMTARS